MASKPFRRSFGGWFDALKDRRRSSCRGAAVAAPFLLSKVSYSYVPHTLQCPAAPEEDIKG